RIDTTSAGGIIQCPAQEAPKAVRLLREMVLEPAFPQREVRRVQQETLADIESEAADPYSVARWRFRAEVYGPHPFARPPWGSRESTARLRATDLRRWHRTRFVPDGGYVAVAGPAEVEESLDLCAKVFRSFRAPTPERPTWPDPPLPAQRRDLHVPMPREQIHVFVGHAGVRRTHPDFVALQVLDHVLGSGPGFTSRIAKRLRDEEGLCYSVHAGITGTAGVQPGVFQAYIGTSPEHRQRAVDGFLEEMQRLRDEPPAGTEVEDVEAYLTGSFVLGLERNTNLVDYAIRTRRFGLGYDWVHRYPELVRAVTPEEVHRVACAHLWPDRTVVVSAGAG